MNYLMKSGAFLLIGLFQLSALVANKTYFCGRMHLILVA